MGYKAVNWALAQDIKHSTAKFVLVVMAHRADAETWESFQSVANLSQNTGQDRKTVMANIGRLKEMGLISETGRRVGETGQIPVFILNGTENGTVDSSNKDGSEGSNGTESGTVKQYQKGDGIEDSNGTVFPGNSTVFPSKQSQFSLETVPKTVHGKERQTKPKGKKDKTIGFVLPDWVPPDAWRAFLEMRVKIKKPMTDYAKKLAIEDLKRLKDEGQDVQAVIDQSVLKSWQGFFAVKAANGTVDRHGSFAQQDYHAGIAADGRF